MNSAKLHTDDIKAAANADGGGKYSPFQLARKYIRYYLTAANGKGHGIHSPFVFDLVINVLNDSRGYPEYAAIERLRRQLESDPAVLQIEDMGAGPATMRSSAALPTSGALQHSGTQRPSVTFQRSISDIARRMAKPKKLGQLLFRIARYYQPGRVLELGTSLGLSTAYLAAGSAGAAAAAMGKRGGEDEGEPDGMTIESGRKRRGINEATCAASVFTIEGAPEVAAVAERNFRALGLENINLTVGNFDQVLEGTLDRAGRIGLAFIDGNHRLEPTLRYFDALYGQLSSSAVVIFDDIHWSWEMEEAWESIKKDPRVYLSVDLFFIGLVFFRDSFQVKQDFVIRF